MAERQEERTRPTATGETYTESYGVRNGRRLLQRTGSGRLPEEDGLYGSVEGNQHPSGELEDRASDEDS